MGTRAELRGTATVPFHQTTDSTTIIVLIIVVSSLLLPHIV